MEKGDDRKAARSTLKNMKNRTTAHNKLAAETAEAMELAFGDHDTPAADILVIWDNYFEGLESHNQDILDLRFELKQSIDREVCAAIFAAAE